MGRIRNIQALSPHPNPVEVMAVMANVGAKISAPPTSPTQAPILTASKVELVAPQEPPRVVYIVASAIQVQHRNVVHSSAP